MRREARALLERWGLQVDVDTPAGALGVAERQLLEIARAMIQGSRLLILDEPTAKLNAKEIERLFVKMAALRSMGVGILFISHHLDEIFDIADSVTVLRDGRKVLDGLIQGLDRAELIDAMVGPTSTPALRSTAATTTHTMTTAHMTGARMTTAATSDRSHSAVRLDIRHLSCQGLFEDVSFKVKARECVGLAGLTGSGKEAIGEVLAGLKDFDSGTICLDEVELPGGDVAKHNRAGIGFVPEDRHREGLVLDLSVAENATMTIADRLGRFGFIHPQTLASVSTRLIDRLGIKISTPDQPVSTLSGGNQQKVVLARALARDPRALVLINPTSGVDVASKAALFASIREVASQGAAVLIISDELEELELCDRVLVIRSHRLTREFLPPFAARDLIAEMEAKMQRGVAA
jgi:simple sugar transport system ATP-binding protein